MRQFKIIEVVAISSCFLTLLMYYWYRSGLADEKVRFHQVKLQSDKLKYVKKVSGIPMRHIPLNELYGEFSRSDDEDFLASDNKPALLVNQPGCQIPLAVVNYTRSSKENKKIGTCGERAIFLKKVGENKVQVTIKENIVKKYLRKSVLFECCYQFISRSVSQENSKTKFSACKNFEHGEYITLESDFINIRCHENEIRRLSSTVVYDDVYAFTNMMNTSKLRRNDCKSKYNVLMIGIDTMSIPRFGQTMRRTVNFFREHSWLAYRGYHKVGDNTFPNLMAAFTGKNLSSILDKCSSRMEECKHLMIWSKFKEAGYVTAYGEDYLRLPDTFHDEYKFRDPPTDHYLRPLFQVKETELYNRALVCTGKVPSGQQLLDYALDFAITYKKHPFFGVFWINSFSHNTNSHPQHGDKIVEDFFNRLSYTGVLKDTFIIFFSDHGIRFGEHRLTVESYYDERMPILFIWSPIKFKLKESAFLRNLVVNQFKLVTPYDLYNTLMGINQLSLCNNSIESVSEGCPNCHSLFEHVSANRTCQDASIHEKWCSCHKLYPLDMSDHEGIKSVMHVVSYIKSRVISVKTKRCWGCMNLNLKNILRLHFYYDQPKVNLYYVVAFTMTPGNLSYEATVRRRGKLVELVGTVSVISPYRGLGKCAVNPKARVFCVCQKVKNCHSVKKL